MELISFRGTISGIRLPELGSRIPVLVALFYGINFPVRWYYNRSYL